MMHTQQVDLIFRYKVKDGMDDTFQNYLDIVLALVQEKEPYVLEYSIFKQADGSYLQHERYINEDAVIQHLNVTAEGQKYFHLAADIIDVMAVGETNAEFWKKFEGPHFVRYSRFHQLQRA